jgi:hypothetical protein
MNRVEQNVSQNTRRAVWPGKLVGCVQAVAFWSAIALPTIYLPILIAGLEGPQDHGIFAGLLLLHIVMTVLGHPYRSD